MSMSPHFRLFDILLVTNSKLANLIFTVLIPLLIIFICYIKMMQTMISHSKDMTRVSDRIQLSKNSENSKKLVSQLEHVGN